MAYQKKKNEKELDEYNLAKLKGWLQRQKVCGLQVCWKGAPLNKG